MFCLFHQTKWFPGSPSCVASQELKNRRIMTLIFFMFFLFAHIHPKKRLKSWGVERNIVSILKTFWVLGPHSVAPRY